MTSYRPQELPCYAETAPPAGGLSHGGVAIGYRASEMLLKEVSWPNPEEFEVICAAGSLRGHSKKVFILAAYMPPRRCCPARSGLSGAYPRYGPDGKNEVRKPLIVVAGDFNQWDIGDVLSHYVDIEEVRAGPTRGTRAIDRVFVNFPRACLLYTSPSPRD